MSRSSTDFIDIAGRLENWSVSIRLDKKEASTSIYEELKSNIDEYSHESLIAYLLLESRYFLIQDTPLKSAVSLDKAKELQDHFTDIHRHYLHLAEAFSIRF
ncbi:hypothetical protein [Terribacillus saccharophilus]|uniref:Uncharacterized protein n=1 Tax=Terribacillus saccharophilus TaxID=361277 RepID=A0A268ABN5_9BACI|nr:hypothetical protein [Terribacillus saccharophilus]PAD21530.1 hypothetical protein CHH64_08530 [Terribacillus saccharophilus]